jgi:pyruvate dehydrogenase E2 component (dihydrolipoamide acetyltransferase)
MPVEILMPATAGIVSEATVARWVKNEGDSVKVGDVIAEIETDKATVEVEAAEDGVLGHILVGAGTTGVKVGSVIALLVKTGEALSERVRKTSAAPGPKAAVNGAASSAGLSAAAPARGHSAEAHRERIFASPLARRLAREHSVDLSAILGSGPNGRILKKDVDSAIASGVVAPAAEPAVERLLERAVGTKPHSEAKREAHADDAEFDDIPHSAMRRVIAERLAASKREVPHYYLTIDCELDALLALRREVNESVPELKVSLNDFVIKAVAAALAKVPAANASWTDTALRWYRRVDVSVAVATPTGLITPVLRDVPTKSLRAVSVEMRELADRARRGKLRPAEYQGGGFTISNLGMYGVREFAAIINPPQACILAVGAAEARPVVKDGAITVRTVMSCTLSADHRAVDGAVGAEFLAAFKALVERPLALII